MTNITIALSAVFDLIVLAILLISAVIDGKERTVRPWTQVVLLIVSVIHTVFAFGHYGKSKAMQYIWAFALMAGIYIVLILVFKGNGIGGGDAKMTPLLALYLGVIPALIMIVVHALAALMYSAYEKAVHNKVVSSVPLMIFIAIGYVAAKAVEWLGLLLQ